MNFSSRSHILDLLGVSINYWTYTLRNQGCVAIKYKIVLENSHQISKISSLLPLESHI